MTDDRCPCAIGVCCSSAASPMPCPCRGGCPPSYAASGYSLDPTFPEVQERLRADAARLTQWGLDLIKHDFTTVDLLGTWANHGGAMAQPHAGWHFHDRSRTNAELLRQLYHLISDAAEGATIIGCQSIGHLGVGAIDLQRIGGDVDGRGWQRTRRMGINSLAFRRPPSAVCRLLSAAESTSQVLRHDRTFMRRSVAERYGCAQARRGMAMQLFSSGDEAAGSAPPNPLHLTDLQPRCFDNSLFFAAASPCVAIGPAPPPVPGACGSGPDAVPAW